MPTATMSSGPDAPLSPDDVGFEPAPGMRLGSYELVKRIASGGMAQVWAAERSGEFGFRRACAVKVIRPEYASSPAFRRMFLDEARIASRIHHPHVVEVFDLGESGPIVYQAMELVKGCTLAQMLARAAPADSTGSRRGLEAGLVCRIVADMARGLHAAHELTDDGGRPLGLVHRDVSPQNILISVDGMAKIADFGIAKAIGRVAEETDAGQLKGKLSYLSPEQAERKPIDRRSDVFASGIVLWEALSGRRLFRGDDAVDTLAKVRQTVVPDLRQLAPVPEAIALVAERALQRSPERRYATAAELSDALEAAALQERVYLTTPQLAAVVNELAAPERSRAVEGRQVSGSSPTTPDTHGGMSGDTSSKTSAARVAVWAALGLAVALTTAAATLLLTHKGDAPAPALAGPALAATSEPSEPSGAAASSAAAAGAATMGAGTRAAAPAASASVATAAPVIAAPVTASPAPAVRRGRGAAPAGVRRGVAAPPSGAPKLPFDDPY